MPGSNNAYKSTKVLIEAGHITQFNQIFDTVRRTNLATDLGMNYQTLVYRINRPVAFSLEELFAIARLIDVEPLVIIQLVLAQIANKKKGKS